MKLVLLLSVYFNSLGYDLREYISKLFSARSTTSYDLVGSGFRNGPQFQLFSFPFSCLLLSHRNRLGISLRH